MSQARILTLWLAGVFTSAMLTGLQAAQPEAPASDARASAPRFSLNFVPAEYFENATWSENYLPIAAERFRQLVELVSSGAAGTPSASAARLERADYTARLVGDDLLVGTAVFRLSRRSEQVSLLKLDPCSLALGSAVWRDVGDRPATIGTAGNGSVCVLVEGTELQVEWSLRAEPTGPGIIQFPLALPPCSVTELTIDAPTALDFSVDRGIANRQPGETTNRSQWTIALGGVRRATLRAVAEGTVRERRPLTLLRQSATYELTRRGVNIAAKMKLDVHGDPLREIVVKLDGSALLVAARYGELQIPFAQTDDSEAGETRLVMQLPETISGTGRVLQLNAIAPLEVGKRFRLPTVQLDGMAWQEGTATLLIPRELVLTQLDTDGCRQSRMAALPAPFNGESVEIQFFRPDASVDVVLREPRKRMQVASGALVTLGANDITCRQTVSIDELGSDRRRIEIPVRTPWSIDSVEDMSTNEPLPWEVDDPQPDGARLTVQLAGFDTSQRPIRLLVRGHRPPLPDPVFKARQLVMLRLNPRPNGDRLISVEGAEGMELVWTGAADLRRMDPLNLTPQQLELFPERPLGALFAADTSFAQSTVGIDRQRARYSADIRIDAAVQSDTLVETYTIQCVPETTRMDRLLVRFSEARDAPLEWSLAGANSGQFSARRLTESEQAQNALSEGGEAWEINLQLERSGSFELRAVRATLLDGETPVALASVAQAAVQRGTVSIRAVDSSGVEIHNRSLPAVPAELLEQSHYQTVRGTYHYQPGRDDLGNGKTIAVAPVSPTQAASGAWIWSGRLDSRYCASGQTVNWATYLIQSAGKRAVHVTLPDNAKLLAAWVDEASLPNSFESDQATEIDVELPPGRAFATLTLYYGTPGRLPMFSRAVQPALPRLDIPGTVQQWTVWLPPGYEIVDASGRYPVDSLTPPTLAQRLFGTIGRDAESTTFNPLNRASWERLAPGTLDTQAARRAGQKFAEKIGTLMTEHVSGDGESDLTWGQLLALCAENVSQARGVLLVDSKSLPWCGVSPRTRVRYQPGESALERGLGLLQQARLSVLFAPGVIAVTSAQAAAVESRQLVACEQNLVFCVSPGPLAEGLSQAARNGRESDFLSVAAWRVAPSHSIPPWSQLDQSDRGMHDAGAWQTYTIYSTAGAQPRVRIVHETAMRSLAWPVFLAVVAVGIWRREKPPTAPVMLGALAGVLSLLLPAAFIPLTSAAFVGATVCLSLRLVEFRVRYAAPGSEASHRSTGRLSVGPQVAVIVIAAAILHCGLVLRAAQPPTESSPQSNEPTNESSGRTTQRAQSPAVATDEEKNTPPAPSKAPPVHQVYVPVDEKRQPVDGNYYLPESLYKQLLQQAGTVEGAPQGWLTTRAVYRGSLARDSASKQLKLDRLTVGFDVRVLQSQTEVELPFPRSEDRELVNEVRLNGRPIAVQRSTDGSALEIGQLQDDVHRIEFILQPSMRTFGANAGFDLAVPPIPGASLELSIPPDAPRIEIPTARGPVRKLQDLSQIEAQLGDSSRLSVRWPAGIGMETSAANAEVEELIWVKVQPGTTVFDVRFKYRVLEGSLQQLRLVADSRLRLLPSTSATSPVAAVQTVAGDPQRIILDLSRPASDTVTIDLSFLFTGTSGVGNLQLPRLETTGVRPARRALAVSVDPALESKEFPGEDSRPMAIAEFLAAWGDIESRPQAAYHIPRGEAMWVLATQPNTPRTAAEQTVTIGLRSGWTRMHYSADLTIDDGYVFQLELDGPPMFEIENASLIEGEVERVARWASDDSGHITLFLNGPLTGRQRLTLRGHAIAPASGLLVDSRLALRNAEIDRNRWLVFRDSTVTAEVDPGSTATPYRPDTQPAREEFGTLVGAYESRDSAAGLKIEVSPNTPRATATTVTTLRRDGDLWMVDHLSQVAVSEGTVDALVFEIPPQWDEPFRIEPPAQFKVIAVPGEANRQLVVYPAKPISDAYQMTVRGRVALSAGDRLRVPDIALRHAGKVEQYVVLPQRVELQQLSWETVGLDRAKLPPAVAPHVGDISTASVLRVEGDRFQAALKGVQRADTAARIKLADIHLAWQADDRCYGVASFDIEPAGATSCVLEMPSQHELLHASIEGVPVQLHSVDEGRLRVSLGPPSLPQRMQVVFAGPILQSGGSRRFEAPRLLDLDVEETLWTVYGPANSMADASAMSESPVGAARQELSRLSAVADLALLPAEIRGEHLPEEILRWYRPWRQRYATAREGLTQALVAEGRQPDATPEALQAQQLDEQIAEIDERLGSFDASAPQVAPWVTPAQLLSAGQRNATTLRYANSGSQRAIELPYHRSISGGWFGRIALSMMIVALATAGILLLRRRDLPKLAPGVVVTLVGAIWWLFLAPSVIGFAAIAFGAWMLLYERGAFRRRSVTA